MLIQIGPERVEKRRDIGKNAKREASTWNRRYSIGQMVYVGKMRTKTESNAFPGDSADRAYIYCERIDRPVRVDRLKPV